MTQENTPNIREQSQTKFLETFTRSYTACKTNLKSFILLMARSVMFDSPVYPNMTLQERIAALNVSQDNVAAIVLFSIIKQQVNSILPGTFDANLGIGKEGQLLDVRPVMSDGAPVVIDGQTQLQVVILLPIKDEQGNPVLGGDGKPTYSVVIP